eukprot:scaffold23070_cov22-Tisochrysis_lutea.AAC.2
MVVSEGDERPGLPLWVSSLVHTKTEAEVGMKTALGQKDVLQLLTTATVWKCRVSRGLRPGGVLQLLLATTVWRLRSIEGTVTLLIGRCGLVLQQTLGQRGVLQLLITAIVWKLWNDGGTLPHGATLWCCVLSGIGPIGCAAAFHGCHCVEGAWR